MNRQQETHQTFTGATKVGPYEVETCRNIILETTCLPIVQFPCEIWYITYKQLGQIWFDPLSGLNACWPPVTSSWAEDGSGRAEDGSCVYEKPICWCLCVHHWWLIAWVPYHKLARKLGLVSLHCKSVFLETSLDPGTSIREKITTLIGEFRNFWWWTPHFFFRPGSGVPEARCLPQWPGARRTCSVWWRGFFSTGSNIIPSIPTRGMWGES
jgi:hypothetical protein